MERKQQSHPPFLRGEPKKLLLQQLQPMRRLSLLILSAASRGEISIVVLGLPVRSVWRMDCILVSATNFFSERETTNMLHFHKLT